MADSLEMAGLAFGARRPRLRGAVRTLRGAVRRGTRRRATAGPRRRRRARARGFPSRRAGGIRLSNEFVKTFILVNMIRGMKA